MTLFAYSNTRLVDMGKGDLRRIVRRDVPRCAHCLNSGRVIIDHDAPGVAEFAVPCPMCEVGMAHETSTDGGGFWRALSGVDRAELSWQRGLTLEHTETCIRPRRHREPHGPRCNQPARHRHGGAICDYHLANPSPGPGAAGSVRPPIQGRMTIEGSGPNGAGDQETPTA